MRKTQITQTENMNHFQRTLKWYFLCFQILFSITVLKNMNHTDIFLSISKIYRHILQAQLAQLTPEMILTQRKKKPLQMDNELMKQKKLTLKERINLKNGTYYSIYILSLISPSLVPPLSHSNSRIWQVKLRLTGQNYIISGISFNCNNSKNN